MQTDESGSPVEERTAGERASEAFGVLGNETRLNILVALWEEVEPFEDEDSVSFSALRERVGTRDSGQFNYHLEKLVGHFVESREDGYALTGPGLTFVRSMIAGAGIESPTLESTDVDATCTLCGAQVQITYEDGLVRVLCSECDGIWAEPGDRPTGQLAKFSLDPAGLANRSPDEIYAAAWVYSFHQMYSMIEGVCPVCSGTVERSLDVCTDHAEEGVCPDCDRTAEVGAMAHCSVCKDAARMTPGVVSKFHPAVVGFFYDHGLSLQFRFNDLDHIERRLELGESAVDLTSSDPPRVRVTHEVDGDAISVDLDADLSVIDVSRAE